MDASQGPLQQSPPRPAGAAGDDDDDVARRETAWPRGQLVRVRGDRWRIESGQAFAGCRLLWLAGAGRTNGGRRLALLCPFDRPRPLASPAGLRRVGWRAWLRAFRALVASATPCGRLRTASGARIALHAYQLEPALALLTGLATRILVADEVGLGKTIEAGLIVSELRAREPDARTLILTPAGLRDQWASELRDHFAIEAAIVDAALVRRALGQVAAGTNPWAIWPVVIASLDFVKRPDVLRALDPFTWDALVVDEAHRCALAPDRSAAVRRLAARARRLVLLTATPHAGDDQAFAALCRIGQIEPSDTIVMFRRARRDVGFAHVRRVRLLRVRVSDDERRMHRLLERYTKAVWASAAATGEARLAMIVLCKRALSSAASLARSLERRLDALFDVPPDAAQLALPFAGDAEPEDETPEDDEPAGSLAAPGLEGRREREWLTRVLNAARIAARRESKIACLARLLRRVREPAVIFTEYRDTARWLTAALQALGPVVLLHGGLSRIERQQVERQFRTGGANLLVATDAAAEGLNLQHRCRLVVNLELPWNPMRLEQRIGRVDRLGQARRPHAIHMVARATAEEHVVRRLVVRQERARRSLGGVLCDAVGASRHTVGEDEVAAAVMAGASAPPSHQPDMRDRASDAPFQTIDLRELASDEARRLQFIRNVAAAGRRPAAPGVAASSGAEPYGGGSPGGCLASLPRRRARRCKLRPGLLCVFVVRLVDAQGSAEGEVVVPLHVDLARPAAAIDGALVAALARFDRVKDRARAASGDVVRSCVALHAQATAAAIARERALASADRPAVIRLQPGMFDRRVLVEAERVRTERASRDAQRFERLAVLGADGSRAPAPQVELALVLIVPGP